MKRRHGLLGAGFGLLLLVAGVASTEAPMVEDPCIQEVHSLHRFFVDWFTGHLANDHVAFARVEAALDESFQIIGPDGRLQARAELLPMLAEAYGSRADRDFRIEIRRPRKRRLSDHLCLVTYEEWQYDRSGTRAWQSSALLERHAGAPGGWVWLHVHETLLPAEIVASDAGNDG